MKPVYQTQWKVNAEDETIGNCLQACVASILDLDLDQVPHFMLEEDWWGAFVSFCGNYNLRPICIDRKKQGPYAWDCWTILTGQSKRGPYLHALVAFDGKFVHDPYPGGNCEIGALVDE